MHEAIRTAALRKVYAPSGPRGDVPVTALDGLDLTIGQGEMFGLLGPNGAGKTTAIGVLTTRVRPTSGQAQVAGHDVLRDPVEVRRRIGVVPQRPNPDRALSARENLLFHAAYFGYPMATAQRRATELLSLLGIADKAAAKVDALSGGQQQRLMIARALMHEPEVLFLDEPTVGLDPNARAELWRILRDMHGRGHTIVMTTHYMEEADALCQRVAIVDRGRLLAVDTPAALKARAPGGTLVELQLDGPAEAVVAAVQPLPAVERVVAHGPALHVYSPRGGELIPALIRAVEAHGRAIANIRLHSPSLESLFVSLTGRKLD